MKPLLCARTDLSVGDSILSPKDVMTAAKNAGLDHVVIADTMSVSAMIPAYQAADGVQPIVGASLTIVDDPTLREKKVYNPMMSPRVFAKNEAGMQDIFRLISRGFEEDQFYSRPRVSIGQLIECVANKNVIVTTGDLYGFFQHPQHELRLMELLDAIDAEDLFIELCPIPTLLFDRLNARGIEAAGRFQLQTLVTHPLLHDGKKQAFITNLGIAKRSDVRREASMWKPHYNNFEWIAMSELVELCQGAKERIAQRYPHIDQGTSWRTGLTTGQEKFIANAAYRWEPKKVCLPSLASDPDEALKDIVKKGLVERINTPVFGYKPTADEVREKYLPRLRYELGVLKDMGFSDYFLVVSDLVNWAKSNDILVGPGRGSVGGSLVAYCMGITDVDPIRFDLLFERFINPSRNDLPDADLDFMSTRRQEVIRYLEDRYGLDRVAGITNYNTLKSASALRDVARVYGKEAHQLTVTALVPKLHGQPVDLETARKEVAEIDMFAENEPDIWADAVALQEVTRSFGKHAAGIIVAGEDIINRAVIERRSGERSVNWDMSVVEQMGLIKLDILGLSTLDVLGRALRFIEDRHGKKIDIATVPIDDEKTLEAFSNGETTGIFQFEGGQARRILKDMSQSSNVTFDDIVAANALNRPGPIEAGLVEQYVNRRNGDEEVSYPHPATQDALEPTFGVMVYQEQIMRVSVDLCGFTLSEADTLRKIVGKKKKDAMAEQRDKFVRGAVDHSGMDPYRANELFDIIEGFAGYAFNKSHAAEYSLISFQMMWLKVHYPVEFYAAALSTVEDEKLQPLVQDAANRSVSIVPPDVNISGYDFVIKDDKTLVTPFNRVKGMSDKTAEAILEAREAGPFLSFEDFESRVPARRCNKTHKANLTLVGAFASVDATQEPPTSLSRRKDQMILLPGLQVEPMPAARTLDVGRAAMLRLKELIEEYHREDDVDEKDEHGHVEISAGARAKMMIVSDAPNFGEAKTGRFGKGQSCEHLIAALTANDLNRGDVYITGLLKRPKDGKIITAGELKRYLPYLERELEITKPPVIVTLGSASVKHFLPKLKGSPMDFIGRSFYDQKRDCVIIVGFNPGMVFHDPAKLDLLISVFETATRLART